MIPLGLWHCFGHREEMVDIQTIRAMLDASETELLPINTHGGKLRIGHQVLWEDFKDEASERGLTPCLNVNLCTNAHDAYKQARWAIDETGITLLKLEVLDETLTDSNDVECLMAAWSLQSYEVMPLLRRGESAIKAAALGCPVIRMMGSPIGSGEGILHPAHITAAVKTDVPIVLDGGIGTVGHARRAMELGCKGFLVNSCLFNGDPVDNLGMFSTAFAVAM